jgi:hypothetical protein
MRISSLFIWFIIGFCVQESRAQEEQLDSLLDVIVFEDEELVSLLTGKKNYQFLYARTHFENRSYFSGRDIGIEQYNYSAQLSYFHSAGVNLAVGMIWYSQFNPKLYATSLSAGYSGKIGKNNDYRYRASYNRYLFSKMDSVDAHAFNSAFAAGLTIDKGFIGTRFDLALLTGDETAGQASIDLFGDITLVKLGTFDKIKFEPEISFFLGKEIMAYYELGGPGQNQEYYLVEDSEFGLLNMALHFPISIDFKNFDLELAYNINFPNSTVSEEDLPMTSYFNLSLGYIISLN